MKQSKVEAAFNVLRAAKVPVSVEALAFLLYRTHTPTKRDKENIRQYMTLVEKLYTSFGVSMVKARANDGTEWKGYCLYER